MIESGTAIAEVLLLHYYLAIAGIERRSGLCTSHEAIDSYVHT